MNNAFILPDGVCKISLSNQIDWDRERLNGVGGSEINSLLPETARSPWGCPRQLAYTKLKYKPDYAQKSKKQMQAGKDGERGLLEDLANSLEAELLSDSVTYYIKDNPLVRVNVDDIYTKKDGTVGVAECKLVRGVYFQEYLNTGIPQYYIAQAQWGAGILGLKETAFVIGNRETGDRFFDIVPADKDIFNHLVNLAMAFWEAYIIPGKLPEKIDNMAACKRCVFRKQCKGMNSRGDFINND